MAGSFPRSAERTRAEILDVATVVFARGGFAGTRVDEIAAGTSTTKRMIYYYFGGKEQLYQAVLERALARLRPSVAITPADAADPLGLIRRITEQTFAQYVAHPDLVRLLITENLQGSGQLPTPPDESALAAFQQVLDAGGSAGSLRRGLRAADVIMIINSVCQYRISGRDTHRTLFGIDLLDPERAIYQQKFLTALVLSFVTTPVSP